MSQTTLQLKNFESQITIGYALGNPKTDTVIMQIGFAIYFPRKLLLAVKKRRFGYQREAD